MYRFLKKSYLRQLNHSGVIPFLAKRVVISCHLLRHSLRHALHAATCLAFLGVWNRPRRAFYLPPFLSSYSSKLSLSRSPSCFLSQLFVLLCKLFAKQRAEAQKTHIISIRAPWYCVCFEEWGEGKGGREGGKRFGRGGGGRGEGREAEKGGYREGQGVMQFRWVTLILDDISDFQEGNCVCRVCGKGFGRMSVHPAAV